MQNATQATPGIAKATRDVASARNDLANSPLFAQTGATTWPAGQVVQSAADLSTSHQAAHIAASQAGRRYRQIIDILAASGEGGACIFEVAAVIGCFDHQISGRFGELEKLGLIRKAGQRRTKPATGCQAEVYEIAQ